MERDDVVAAVTGRRREVLAEGRWNECVAGRTHPTRKAVERRMAGVSEWLCEVRWM
jgi:hypothetical protein